MNQAIIYRRASTNETQQRNSLDNQSRELVEFAMSNGYEVIEDYYEYQSASKGLSRSAFDKALSRLRQCNDLTLIVHDFTRLSRDIGTWNDWVDLLPQIRFANSGNKALTELEASLMLIIAANESRTLSERISKGIKRSKERALESGKTWTWGGNKNPVTARASLESKTKAWRDQIKEVCHVLESKGLNSLKKKTDWLNQNGFTNQRGKPISSQTLHNALRA
jgi:DNA invertase Pin-like site-specific DNA recombinase